MRIYEDELGLLETAMYIGVVLGTLLCPILIMPNLHPRTVIISASVLNGLTSLVVALTHHYILIFFSRVLTGLFLSVFLIYLPVWIDFKAPPHLQTLWICMFYFTEDLGMALGYGLSSIFSAVGITWKAGFYIQAGAMIVIVGLMFIIVPE